MRVLTLIFNDSFLQSDTDTNSGSETSDTSDIDMGLDNKDPNLHNPMVSKPLTHQGHFVQSQSFVGNIFSIFVQLLPSVFQSTTLHKNT